MNVSQAAQRAMSIQSCLNAAQRTHVLEIQVDEAEPQHQRSMPDCLFPVDSDDSGSDGEVDFSKDRELHDKRTPAVYMGRDSTTGEAKYSMPSPSRANADIPQLPGPGLSTG